MDKSVLLLIFFIFIAGTFTASVNHVSASELVKDSWNTKTPMNYERSSGGVVVLDGKIFVIGGYNNGWYESANECYDPETDYWLTLEPMPTPRSNFAMAAYQGKIYCIGGRTYIFNSPALARSLDIVEVYDPITDSWSSKASFPNESAYQAHVVNGQLFVITHYGEMYMYNPATDSWTNRTTIPLERYAFSVVADNKIIVGDHLSIYSMGGGTTFSDRLGIKIYDPKTNRCREGKTSPDLTVFVGSTVGGATTGVYAPKKVYVFGLEFNGGYNTGSGQPFTWVYDPINDSWSTAQAGNSDIAVAINDVLYVIGGTATKQYVPMGYNPQGYPLEHSFFLTNSVRVVTVLIITCVIVTILFFYFKKKHVVRGL